MAGQAIAVRPHRVSVAVALAGCAAAGGIGVLTAVDPILAVASAAGIAALVLALTHPLAIALLLVGAVYAEVMMVGGITVGRLAAPISAVAVFVALLARGRVRLRRTPAGLVALYAALAVASLLWTTSIAGTLEALGSLAIAVVSAAVFALTVRSQSDLRAVLVAVVLASSSLGAIWIHGYVRSVDRFANIAGDPNRVAMFQLIALPAALALAATSRRAAARLIAVSAAALIAASVIATLSRGGFAALVAVGIALAIVPARALFRSAAHKAAVLGLGAAGLALALAIIGPDLQGRFEPAEPFGTRADLWATALHAYGERPVTGIGFGAYKPGSYDLLRRTPGVDLASHLPPSLSEGRVPHNAYLGSLAELGPAGAMLFIAILASTGLALARAARRARRAGDPLVRAAATALGISLFAAAVASVSLSTETTRAIWMIVGLSIALAAINPSPVAVSDSRQPGEAGRPG